MSIFLINSFQFHPWVAILYDDVVENYDADENDEDPDNDEDTDINQYPDNDQIPYIDQDPDNGNHQDYEDTEL